MSLIISELFRQTGLDKETSQEVALNFKHKLFKKGELFVKEGVVSQHMAYINVGIMQYFFNMDGEEKTSYVSGDKTFVASLFSFLRGVPSKENIRAITDAECYLIHKSDLDRLKMTNPKFQAFYVGLVEQLILCIDESRYKLMMLSAEQRYLAMMKDEPQLLQQIPLQYLASVLGVTPRHLSRIRAEIR